MVLDPVDMKQMIQDCELDTETASHCAAVCILTG